MVIVAGAWFLARAPKAEAQGETRSLTIVHTHTKEEETVVFKRYGRYEQAGLDRLNHLLRDWRNDEATTMDPRLFDVVWQVYREAGAGSSPITVLSAYRSPGTNAALRRRSRGPPWRGTRGGGCFGTGAQTSDEQFGFHGACRGIHPRTFSGSG